MPEKSFAHIYYVAVNGKNSSNGSVGSPLKTVNYALSLAKPGDTVMLRSGAYHEKISFPNSGAKGRYITLKSYKGERVAIDGSGLAVRADESLILISGVSWIAIEGLDIRNFRTTMPGAVPNGISVKDGASEIIISNNSVHHIENTTPDKMERSAHAIHILGNTDRLIQHILIADNRVFDCKTGYSENVTVNGYVDGFIIRRNKVYNGENIGIDAAGGYRANKKQALNYARNGVISDNEVYQIDDSHGAPGIYADGARNIVIERNKVHDVFRGIGVLSENTGYPAENCIVRNNFVYNNDCAGIYMGGYEGQEGGGGTRNCSVVNNTLFFNNRRLGYYKEVEGEIRMKMGCEGNTISNNILYVRPDRGVFINKVNKGGKDNAIDHNMYFSKGISSWIWDGTVYTDFSAWKEACQGDRSSLNGADPGFNDTTAPDLRLKHNPMKYGVVQ